MLAVRAARAARAIRCTGGVLAALLAAIVVPANAAAPATQHELDVLLARLATSRCEFERNGRWYGAERAEAHLRRKFAYLDSHHLADTTADFIARGASASSRSGKPYHVRCPGQRPIESGVWFRRVLDDFRASPSRR